MKLPEIDILDVASGRYMTFRTDVGIGQTLRSKGAFEPHLANGVTTRMGQPFATLAAKA